jgi:hypothetical protein
MTLRSIVQLCIASALTTKPLIIYSQFRVWNRPAIGHLSQGSWQGGDGHAQGKEI